MLFCVLDKQENCKYRQELLEILEENDIRFPNQITYEDAYFEALLHFYVERIYILEEQLYHYFVNQNSTILLKNADHHTDWITVQIIG